MEPATHMPPIPLPSAGDQLRRFLVTHASPQFLSRRPPGGEINLGGGGRGAGETEGLPNGSRRFSKDLLADCEADDLFRVDAPGVCSRIWWVFSFVSWPVHK